MIILSSIYLLANDQSRAYLISNPKDEVSVELIVPSITDIREVSQGWILYFFGPYSENLCVIYLIKIFIDSVSPCIIGL